jgi:hypothetical protein
MTGVSLGCSVTGSGLASVSVLLALLCGLHEHNAARSKENIRIPHFFIFGLFIIYRTTKGSAFNSKQQESYLFFVLLLFCTALFNFKSFSYENV